jgi:hypothetical protein
MITVVDVFSRPADWWFEEHTSIEPLDIAPGVYLRPKSDRSFLVYNSTEIPLYVLQHKPDSYIRDELQGNIRTPRLADVPSHLYVSAKIVRSQVYVWAGTDTAGNEQWEDVRNQDGAYASTGIISKYFYGYRNRNISKDFRPRNVQLPAPMRYMLTLLYDHKLYQTAVIQRYTLNQSYDSIAKSRHDVQLIIVFIVAMIYWGIGDPIKHVFRFVVSHLPLHRRYSKRKHRF